MACLVSPHNSRGFMVSSTKLIFFANEITRTQPDVAIDTDFSGLKYIIYTRRFYGQWSRSTSKLSNLLLYCLSMQHSIARTSNDSELTITQPNLASTRTPLSALFVPELLTEIFKHATLEDLRVYTAVCLQWEEPAQARLLETVHLDNIAQMRYLHTKPTFRRYVRNLVTAVDFDTPVHELLVPELTFSSKDHTPYYHGRPMNITSWHLVGPVPFRPSRFLISGINSYSRTLHTFHVHDSIWLDLEGFCDLLNALGSCQRLENLALPTDLQFKQYKTSEQRLACCEETFSALLLPSLNRPRILQLQLVSTNRRYRLCAAKPMNAIHTIWITHPNCPLIFANTSQLIVGQGADLQRLLPLVPALESLEICCESPMLWPNYDQLLRAPLNLPFLKSLRLGFRQMDAVSSCLRIIDAPNIESVRIRYDWLWHPYHHSFFDNNLREVIQEVARMGVEESFPKLLKIIYLEGFWYTPQPLPVEPPKWLSDILKAGGMGSDVRLLLELLTLPESVFMSAHDAIY
ncbi:hypothetical protein BT96DRAFT_991884 [Gymnopus androsaceus JB14]|uniref:F-box domain-containing protein n=1 Tax=Gymnopus androsaceus JB14 TaxID=1447944 RepID=A0A6A4HRJ9_9AGAR|nr:hypothetical protein BT96DRAFT_991884 [Gymnopus androsaceus JB14]